MKANRMWTVWMCALGLASMATAQADSQRTRLLRAVVIEEEERDLPRAVAAYREVVQAATDAEVRADAELRLATALCAIGKKEEAQPLLEAIVKTGGARGQKAGEVLAATNDQERWLWARTQAALSVRGDHVVSELVFLGRGAVPHVLRQLWLGDPMDRNLLENAVMLMCRVGGSESVEGIRALVQHKDVVVRRTCATTFAHEGNQTQSVELAPDVVPAFALLLADSSPEVRRAAVSGRFGWNDIKPLLDDPDDSVRDAAFSRSALGIVRDDTQRKELIAALTKEITRSKPVRGAWFCAQLMKLFANGDERDLWLRFVAHPAADVAVSSLDVENFKAAENEHVDAALATAEAIAKRDPRLRAVLEKFVQAASQSWDRRLMEKALRLHRLGWFRVIDWLERVAKPDDAAAIIEHIDGTDADRMYRLLSRWKLPATSWQRLADLAQQTGDDHFLVLALRTEADDAMRWARDLPLTANRYRWIVSGLSDAKTPTPAMQELMQALLDVLPGAGDPVFHERTKLFWAVAVLGRDDAVPRLAAAYTAGVREGLGIYDSKQLRARGITLDAAHIARVVDACLATGVARAFDDAKALLRDPEVAPAVYAAICRHALKAKDPADLVDFVLNCKAAPAITKQFALDVLRNGDTASIGRALRYYRHAGVRDPDALPLLVEHARGGKVEAVSALGECEDRRQADVLTTLLAHEARDVRSAAMWSLHKLLGADAVELLLPMARDQDSSVRASLISIAATSLDRRFAPTLLGLLRDANTQNREGSQKALEAIDFYHTQTARWQRLLSDTGLDAPSAAEALVKQARAGNDKAVRLAAITSLGTLKVAETLPVLIQLMQDPDADIAAAAKAAVAKING